MPAAATKSKQKPQPKATKATNGKAPAKAQRPAAGTHVGQAVQSAPAQAPSGQVSSERHQNEGHGRRLTLAFEALMAVSER